MGLGVKPGALHLLGVNCWIKYFIYELRMVTYNPSTWKAEAGGPLYVCPGLQRDTLSQNTQLSNQNEKQSKTKQGMVLCTYNHL